MYSEQLGHAYRPPAVMAMPEKEDLEALLLNESCASGRSSQKSCVGQKDSTRASGMGTRNNRQKGDRGTSGRLSIAAIARGELLSSEGGQLWERVRRHSKVFATSET